MFDLTIISPRKVVFENEVEKVLLDGEQTEFELSSFHAPLIDVLRSGRIVIDGKRAVAIERGVVNFFNNRCVILIEEKKNK